MHRLERPRWSLACARLLLAGVVALFLASFATAAPKEDRGKGKGKKESSEHGKPEARKDDEKKHEDKARREDDVDDDDDDESDGGDFGRSEERTIRDWFSLRRNLRALPPGLRKREDLPPGLDRQVRERGTLPHGLQKRVEPLPRELESQLPRLPERTRRVVLGRDLLLLDDSTMQIRDILRDVLPR